MFAIIVPPFSVFMAEMPARSVNEQTVDFIQKLKRARLGIQSGFYRYDGATGIAENQGETLRGCLLALVLPDSEAPLIEALELFPEYRFFIERVYVESLHAVRRHDYQWALDQINQFIADYDLS